MCGHGEPCGEEHKPRSYGEYVYRQKQKEGEERQGYLREAELEARQDANRVLTAYFLARDDSAP